MKLQYQNIFEAIAESEEEAADLRFRADLILMLRDYFRERSASEARIAEILCVPKPRVSDLVSGRVDKFSVDALAGFLAKVDVEVPARESHV